jgi:hypothetical protein
MDIDDVRAPAALIVDHQATGHESHMVGFMGMKDGLAEILDPLEGRVMMTKPELSEKWHGKALEIYRRKRK